MPTTKNGLFATWFTWGRAHDGLVLAKNLCELPKHPKYNTLKKRGSFKYGRQRLHEVLTKFEMWEEAVAACGNSYFEPTDEFTEQVKRIRLLGRASIHLGRIDDGQAQLNELEQRLDQQRRKKEKLVAETQANDGKDKASEEDEPSNADEDDDKKQDNKKQPDEKDDKASDKKAVKELDGKIDELEKGVAELNGLLPFSKMSLTRRSSILTRLVSSIRSTLRASSHGQARPMKPSSRCASMSIRTKTRCYRWLDSPKCSGKPENGTKPSERFSASSISLGTSI